MKTEIRFIEWLELLINEEKKLCRTNTKLRSDIFWGDQRIIFRKNIYSPLSFSKSWGLFDRIFLKLHRAHTSHEFSREKLLSVLSIYASITTTTTTIFSDLYLPNGLLLQGIIIIVWVKFFQRWIILAENPIKKLELFFRPTLINTFCSFRKGKIKLDY